MWLEREAEITKQSVAGYHLRIMPPANCGSCHDNPEKGCSNLWGLLRPREMIIASKQVYQIGQRVILIADKSHLQKYALLAYGVPVALIVLTTYLFQHQSDFSILIILSLAMAVWAFVFKRFTIRLPYQMQIKLKE